jgi:hypothetical protein
MPIETDTTAPPTTGSGRTRQGYLLSESTAGIDHLWEVRLPRGGSVQITITPRRATYFMGVAREMAPQLAWRSAQAIGSEDARAFGAALQAAAEKAESLPRATVQ